jgi:hypothetical protein
MRRLLAVVLLAGCAVAQNPGNPGNDAGNAPARGASAHLPPVPQASAQVTNFTIPVSHADMYCSGFLGKEPARKDTYVMGGLNSPIQTRFHARDFIFINGDYQPGTRVSFVRQTKDVDRMEAFKGQTAALRKTGDVFAELGYAVIVEKRGDATVAQVEFSCEPIVPGDYVVPFVAKPDVTYRKHTTTDLFPDRPQTVGRIIAAHDFDQYVATGQKVYFNVGAQKGLKPGDMFYVVRNYRADEMDAVDPYELQTGVFEETRKNGPRMPAHMENKLPERVVAEAVVLNANENSATAMITFALTEVHIGDRIASETAQAPVQQGSAASNFAAPETAKKGARLGPLCTAFAILDCGKNAMGHPAQPDQKTAVKETSTAGGAQ